MGSIDLKVGYSCNDACLHCVVDDFRDSLRDKHQPQDKTLDAIKAEMLDARARGSELTITGGEPTIRPDFVEIIRYARSLDYSICVQTNGRRLSDPKLADALQEFTKISYCIALHGHTAEIHDKITQRPGSFAETVKGFHNLYERHIPYTNKIVLSKYNYQILTELCTFIADLPAKTVNIAYPHAQGRARKLWEQVVPRYSDVAPYVHKAIQTLLSRGVYVSTESMPFCLMEGYEPFIAELRQQLNDYAEINQYGSEQGIMDWSKVRLQIKAKFPQCQACRFTKVCEGPWNEYPRMFGDKEFTPLFGQPVNDCREVLAQKVRHEFAGAFDVL
ncbi:radical SAM protein [bacterium]|nr:radical SAM protein [bacterium]